MREEKSYKKTKTLIVLLLFVICLSIGFAAYTSVVYIRGKAIVAPEDDTLKVIFTTNDGDDSNVVSPITSDEKVNASDAIIDEHGTLIKNIAATFTEPGQSATYNFYVLNKSNFAAALKKVEFKNLVSEEVTKICTSDGGSEALVQNACKYIYIKVDIGEVGKELTFTSSSQVSGHIIDATNWEPIKVTIIYEKADDAYVDGGFHVDFGDIALFYSTDI